MMDLKTIYEFSLNSLHLILYMHIIFRITLRRYRMPLSNFCDFPSKLNTIDNKGFKSQSLLTYVTQNDLEYLSTLLMQQEYPTIFLTCLILLLRGWQQSIQVLGWKHILLVLPLTSER